jgi:hypothetical protein
MHQCGLIARGDDEIEKLFGFRYGHTKPKSWCKSCRSCGSRSESLRVYDAADIWMSNGMDEYYMFGYSE